MALPFMNRGGPTHETNNSDEMRAGDSECLKEQQIMFMLSSFTSSSADLTGTVRVLGFLKLSHCRWDCFACWIFHLTSKLSLSKAVLRSLKTISGLDKTIHYTMLFIVHFTYFIYSKWRVGPGRAWTWAGLKRAGPWTTWLQTGRAQLITGRAGPWFL